ncbi:MAG: aromatic ring hydroxylase [Candidatus Lloydbacteria bacterium CG22_combo_CG10-13_8_21_14_all_47_15]|uniref:Aromatic ring hydroxylase n=1 Tax=Candidatus Lloydbacteria bacterium CG22_combo_CG10-13_8_21_14_all_47_15 TaxID=1974635 RepID=A0A2H0CT28_9BACT|nr:MAG: aromatic ring hydroxylase [Candidatus Lloydbacteria bacterium CG22_combo_CG10-13_8_21_14_all_47_15]
MHITEQKIIKTLQGVIDPELNIDIYTLGLIYEIQTDSDGGIAVTMTLTTPFCPYGNEIVTAVEDALWELKPAGVTVDIVFEPPWKPPEALRKTLGI